MGSLYAHCIIVFQYWDMIIVFQISEYCNVSLGNWQLLHFVPTREQEKQEMSISFMGIQISSLTELAQLIVLQLFDLYRHAKIFSYQIELPFFNSVWIISPFSKVNFPILLLKCSFDKTKHCKIVNFHLDRYRDFVTVLLLSEQ